jgi:hypothetical protein
MTEKKLSVDELNRALRLVRWMFFRITLIAVSGFIGSFALNAIGNMINPPYGVHIAGTGLFEWGMIATILILIVSMYWDGVRLGRMLDDRMMMTMPATAILSIGTVIGQKAAALGMKPGFFMGPLRPISK